MTTPDPAQPDQLPSLAAERLARFTPKTLTTDEWTLASGPLVNAVMAAAPTNAAHTKQLASALCCFLARHSGWDRTAEPDLAELLTPAAIADAGARTGKTGWALVPLRRIERALRTGQPAVQHQRRARTRELPDVAGLCRRARNGSSEAIRQRAAAQLVLLIGAGLTRTEAARITASQVTHDVVTVDGLTRPVLRDIVPFAAAATAGLAPDDLVLTGSRQFGERSASAVRLLALLRSKVPFTLIRDEVVAGGRPMNYARVDLLLAHLDSPGLGTALASCGGPASGGTLPSFVVGLVRALHDAPAPAIRKAVDMTPQVTQAPPARTSRAARQRAVRAAQQSSARAANTTTLPDPAHVSHTGASGGVAALLAGYTPRHVPAHEWAPVADLARRALYASQPATVSRARCKAAHFAPFLAWVQRTTVTDRPLTIDDLFSTDVLNSYLRHGMAMAKPGTRATAGSEIRSVLRALRPDVAPERFSCRVARPPYTEAECAAIVRLARNQPGVASRRNLSLIVALGLGAGLDGRDLRHLTVADVHRMDLPGDGAATAVRVRGPRPRVSIVRRDYEQLLHEALQLKAPSRAGKSLLLGDKPDRTNITNGPLFKAVTADGSAVDIEVARLRNTWLVTLMSAATPLSVLLEAAGLKSTHALTDLLPHTPPHSEADRCRLLAGDAGVLADLLDGDA